MGRPSKKTVIIVISIAIIAVGVAILGCLAGRMNASHPENWVLVVFNIGLSLVVAGMMAFINESFFGETTVKAKARAKALKSGFRQVTKTRKGFSGFYNWTKDKRPKVAKFSGHAVLKSMDQGLPKGKNIVDLFIDQMKNGVNIRVLFYDPEWEMVEKVSTDIANVDASVLYDKLNSSLDIAKDLYDGIKKEKASLSGSLIIKMAREINSYSFHFIGYEDKKNDRYAYVGFYFAGKLGYKSPLFVVEDEDILEDFDRNFEAIFGRAACLLEYSRTSGLKLEGYDRIKTYIENKLNGTP